MKNRSRSRLLILLFAIAALLLASCASDSDSDGAKTDGDTTEKTSEGGGDAPSDVKVGMVFDIGGLGDKSFNDSAYDGLQQAEEELGVETKHLEPSEDGSNREALIRELADEGYNLVIGVGFAFDEIMPGVAGDYPDVSFAIVDGSAEGDNITDLQFAEHEGSFLVGVIAAQASETGTIGYVGGVETPLIQKFEAGYVAGAKAADPDITVEVKYLTPDGDFSGFADPAKGKTTAKGLYDDGADVVYHAAGGSGNGVFQAAAEAKKWVIGVDSDQYLTATEDEKPYVLSSMLKRVDVSVFEAIKSFQEGNLEAGPQVFDLSVDGVGYSTEGDHIEDIDAVEDFKSQIVAGDIEVPSEP